MTGAVAGVFWLGGGPGAGKSTVSLAVTRRLDLRMYAIDGHTYEHMARADARPADYPLTCELLGCERVVEVAVTEYARRHAAGPLTAH